MGSRMDDILNKSKNVSDSAKICLAIRIPDGSTELIINQNARSKISYIANAYDEDLCLKANPLIEIVNYMIYE